MAKQLTFKIKYQWIDLKNKKGTYYCFPDKRGTIEKQLLEHGGVYRWIKTTRKNNRICEYIGESGNMYSRLYGYLYRSKSQATSFRIGKSLKRILRNNRRVVVRFQTLKLLNSHFANKEITNNNFRSMHIRQAIEQSLIAYHKQKSECKLNKEK